MNNLVFCYETSPRAQRVGGLAARGASVAALSALMVALAWVIVSLLA